MTAIEIPHGVGSDLSRKIRRLGTLGISLLIGRSPRRAHASWHRLSGRLLLDIGKSPVDAEVAALRARMGRAGTETPPDAVGSRGLGAEQIARHLRRACHRRAIQVESPPS